MTFHVQGAIPADSSAHVEREFEQRLLSNVTAGRWVLLLGPRQHGKTSGLIRVSAQLREAGAVCALVDLQAIQGMRSYRELLEKVTRRLAPQVGTNVGKAQVEDKGDFSCWLRAMLPPEAGLIAIMIDEASAIHNDEWRNAFYGQIRAIRNESAALPPGDLLRRLVFVFAGTFRWETMVQKENSPFNVIDRLYSEDLSIEGARSLAQASRDATVSEVVDAAYGLVGGQPYLLQRLLIEVENADPGDRRGSFARAVARLEAGDDPHFDALFRTVFEDERLRDLARRLCEDGYLLDKPADVDLRYLEVVGLVKRDETQVIFRNSLYERMTCQRTEAHGESYVY
jgi:hypothetical protein